MIWLRCLSDRMSATDPDRRVSLRVADIASFQEGRRPETTRVQMRGGQEFVLLLSYDELLKRIDTLSKEA